MTTPTTTTGSGSEQRAQAPIRWPRPDGTTLTAIFLWLAGLVVALIVPALIVPPSSETAETSKIWTAFAISVAGALLTLGATVFHLVRKRDSAVLILGLVPAFAVICGGVIFASTMIARQG
jgi:hypothetical protein